MVEVFDPCPLQLAISSPSICSNPTVRRTRGWDGVMTPAFVCLSHFIFIVSLSDSVLELSASWVGPSMSVTRPATARVSTRTMNRVAPAVDRMHFFLGKPLVIVTAFLPV